MLKTCFRWVNVRSLNKRWYRWRHPETYHHNDKIWPDIAIQRDEQGCLQSVVLQGKRLNLLSVAQVQSQMQSSQLVIVASGPSAAQTDLQPLHQADWLMVNGAVSLLAQYPEKSCRYYMVIDQGFVQDRIALMAPILAQPNVIFITTVFCLHKIHQLLGDAAIAAQVCVLEEWQKPVYLPKRDAQALQQASERPENGLYWHESLQSAFSCQLAHGFVGGGTVVYPALQVAAALGYQEVFLAGVDMKDFGKPRFYEQSQNMLPTQLDVNLDKVIVPAFTLASLLYKQWGIRVWNLCVDSGIGDEIFPRISIEQWLEQAAAVEED